MIDDVQHENDSSMPADGINRAFGAQAFVVDRPWGDGDWVVLGSPDPHQATIVADCSMIDDTQGDELPYTNQEAATEVARRWNEVAALRASLDAETRRADDNDDARKRAEAEGDAMRPVVEAAKVESAEHAASGKCFGRDGHTCPLCDAVGDVLRAAQQETNDGR